MQARTNPAIVSAPRLIAAAVAATAASVALLGLPELFQSFEERIIWRTLAAIAVVALVFALDGLTSAHRAAGHGSKARSAHPAPARAGRAPQTHHASMSHTTSA
jgi:hypothetical protein